jgi:cyanate permease
VSQTAPSLIRDRFTVAIGSAYLFLGVTFGALGPVSSQLRRELHLSGTVTGLHGAMFGWCLLMSAFVTPRLVRSIGAARLFVTGSGMLAAGVVLLCSGHHVAVTLAGSALMGLGASVLVFMMPAMLRGHHDERAAVRAFVLVNGVSVIGNVITPMAIAATLRLGWGWRWAMAGIGLAVGATTISLARGAHLTLTPSGEEHPAVALHLLRRNRHLRARWFVQVLGISVEFAVLIWGAEAVQDLGHARAAYGAVGVGLFSAGMAVGRLAGHDLATRGHRELLRWSFAAATIASLTMRFGPGVAGRLVGLFVTGLATALMYPLALTRMFRVEGVAPADIAAVGALASGTAVTFAPLALGAMSDLFGIARAVLLVPLIAFVGFALVSRQRDGIPRPQVT